VLVTDLSNENESYESSTVLSNDMDDWSDMEISFILGCWCHAMLVPLLLPVSGSLVRDEGGK
jgi:hypothetical protein